MAKATYNYYQAGASLSGCPGTAMTGGWYATGSSTPIAPTYLNPDTGAAYTPQELAGLTGGGGTTPSTTTPPGGGETTPGTTPGTTPPAVIPGTDMYQGMFGGEGAGDAGTPAPPAFGDTDIPPPTVTPAPPYEPSAAQTAWETQYGTSLADWLANPPGLGEGVIGQMTQQMFDALKAKESEDLRVMRNNMERRGITNSGFLYANEQNIRSNTATAMAEGIRDIRIKDALLKLASFEKAMGATAQFLGYLSEQSQLANNPAYMTWQAQQMANLQHWQAQFDLLMTDINFQNTQTLNAQLHDYNVILAGMELEAQQQAAMAQGAGSLFGTILGFVFGK